MRAYRHFAGGDRFDGTFRAVFENVKRPFVESGRLLAGFIDYEDIEVDFRASHDFDLLACQVSQVRVD